MLSTATRAISAAMQVSMRESSTRRWCAAPAAIAFLTTCCAAHETRQLRRPREDAPWIKVSAQRRISCIRPARSDAIDNHRPSTRRINDERKDAAADSRAR